MWLRCYLLMLWFVTTLIDQIINGSDVAVVTPEWILLGSQAQMKCTVTLTEGDYIVAVAWNAIDDFSHTDPGSAPNVVYYVVYGNIKDGDEIDRVDFNTTDLSMTILEVLESDERKYFCLVTLALTGSMFDSGTSIVSFPPTSVSIITAEFIHGTSNTLRCKSNHSKPAASLTWHLGGNPLPSLPQTNTSDGSDGYYDSESVLEFTPLWSNHNDILLCIAKVPVDTAGIEDSITLDVKVPPTDDYIVIYDTKVEDKNDTINVVEGEQHVLTCKVTDTRPSAEFEWFINGIEQSNGVTPPITSPISPGYNDLVETTSTLTFIPERANIDQTVLCRATIPVSGVSDAEFNVTLQVFATPSSVTDLTITHATIDAITIAWTAGDNGGKTQTFIIDYKIYPSEEYGDELTANELQTNFTINGLLLGTEYLIRVRSENFIGRNENGGTVVGKTKGPPDPPYDVHILPELTSRTSLTVKWTAGDTGEEHQWFLVDFRIPGKDFTGERIKVPDGDFQFQIAGLIEGATYEIAVYSANMYGVNEDYSSDTDSTLSLSLEGTPTGLIVGSAIGGTLIVIIIVILVAYLCKSSHTARKEIVDKDHLTENRINSDSRVGVAPYQSLLTGSEIAPYQSLQPGRDIPPLQSSQPGIEIALFQSLQPGRDIPPLQSSQPGIEIAPYQSLQPGRDIPPLKSSQPGIEIALCQSLQPGREIPPLQSSQPGTEIASYQSLQLGTENEPYQPLQHEVFELTKMPTPKENNDDIDYEVVAVDYENVMNKDISFPREQLTFIQDLGSGEFGAVKLACAKGIMEQANGTKVAVKMLRDNASEDDKTQFEMELGVMQFLMSNLNPKQTPNIIQLLGYCTEKEPHYMILEYMEQGDLRSFLRKSRLDKSQITDDERSRDGNAIAGSNALSPLQLITFAKEVASGMAFIAGQQCIHRDLAARNVLLNDFLVCKVSDFGLAKDVMGTKVYRRSNETRLPLRWMAYESVLGDEHTIQSDVWSFGVLLWEITTLGARPYPGLKGNQVRDILKAGYRMPQPNHCKQDLYKIMLSCWDKEPSKRPTFEKLIDLLDELIGNQTEYMSLDDLDIKLYEDASLPAPDEKV